MLQHFTILYHILLNDYLFFGKSLSHLKPEVCSFCGAHIIQYTHGYRTRNLILESLEVIVITVLRLKCKHCKKTYTLLPDFLLPKFQHCKSIITDLIRKKNTHYRQIIHFYKKRFTKNINIIQIFLRSLGYKDDWPENEKAIKILEIIDSLPKFSIDFHKHHNKSFMAI